MSLRSAGLALLSGIALGLVLTIWLFPLEYGGVMTHEKWLGNILPQEKTAELTVCDQQTTKGSVLFLAQDDRGNYLLVQAEKSPLFPRYRLLTPISLAEQEVFVAEDFVQRVTVSVSNGSLHVLSTQTHYKSGVWAFCFVLAVAAINVVYAYKQQKRGERDSA